MKCKLCDNPAIRTDIELCKTHFTDKYEEMWANNSDIDDLGIIKWAGYMIPEFVPNMTPYFHRKMYITLLSLFDPFYVNKMERLREFICFRGAAKSTLLAIFILFLVTHNGKKIKIKNIKNEIVEVPINESLITIVSATGASAEEFVVRIRDILTTNEKIKYFYSATIDNAERDKYGQWTRRAFKINNLYVIGVGAGQQLRGKIKGAARPTFVLFDDLYENKDVLTPENRSKIRSWFNGSAMNTIDDIRGKVFVVGTIVHEDTVIVDIMKNSMWKHIIVPIMSIEKFKKLLNSHITTDYDNNQILLPYDEIEDDYEKLTKQREYFSKISKEDDWELAWEERANLYFLASKYKEQYQNGSVNTFYQEYFHLTVSEEDKKFKTNYFQRLPEFEYKKINGVPAIKTHLYDEYQAINIFFGIDIASGSIDGDDTVIVVIGVLPNNKILVLDIISGKYGFRDTLYEKNKLLFKVEQDRSKIERIGWADECIRLAMKYEPLHVAIGQVGAEAIVIQNVRDLFDSNNIYISIIGRTQTKVEGDKFQRIRNTLLPKYEAYLVYHSPKCDKLEMQLEFLGKAKHDDIADALEVAVRYSDKANEVTIETDEAKQYKLNRAFTTAFDWRVY